MKITRHPVTSPIRLQIRKEGDVVKAYFAEGSDRQEIASMCLVAAQDKQLWEEWRQMLTGHLKRFTEEVCGTEVVRVDEFKLREMN